jgi:hypothetical protein
MCSGIYSAVATQWPRTKGFIGIVGEYIRTSAKNACGRLAIIRPYIYRTYARAEHSPKWRTMLGM